MKIIIHCTKRVFLLSIRLAGGEVDARAVRRFSSKSGKLDLFFFFFSFESLTDLCDGIFSMQYNNAQGRFSTTDIKKNANLRRVYFIFSFFFCQIEIKFKNKKEHTAVQNETRNDYSGNNVFVIFKTNNNNEIYIRNIHRHVISSIFFFILRWYLYCL